MPENVSLDSDDDSEDRIFIKFESKKKYELRKRIELLEMARQLELSDDDMRLFFNET